MKKYDFSFEKKLFETTSIRLTGIETTDQGVRSYMGLSTDYDNLPTDPSLTTGATYYATDNGKLWMYNDTNKTWKEQ